MSTRTSKMARRAAWIIANYEAIKSARKAHSDHSACCGACRNGRTCKQQSGGGWGYWAQAFALANVRCERTNYWAGSNPTPSTSINLGVADYIASNAPANLR